MTSEEPPLTDEPQPEQQAVEITLPIVGPTIKFRCQLVGANEWAGEAWCPHGRVTNRVYVAAPDAVNATRMVDELYRLHGVLVPPCNCPREEPKLNATVTFQPANAVDPGQQRYLPQQSGTIEASAKSNLWWGPGLTCAKPGAYLIQTKVQLSRGLTQGARGSGVIVVQGVPVVSVPMIDEGGRATANISATLNLIANQSVAVGYENTSTQVQDAQATALTVSEVWLP